MVYKFKEYLHALFNLISSVIIIIISFSESFKFSIPNVNVKLIGIVIVYIGMGIFLWTAFYLKVVISGMIQPKLNYIIKSGPYKYCRHPLYLGITISFLGLAITLKSWLGIISVLILFLPLVIYRAKLEEKYLLEKFSGEWLKYKIATAFFLPIKFINPN